MNEDAQRRKRKRARLWMALALVAAILAVLVVPPMVSVSRYKSGITRLISASLGRPVRLSSVELRLLPRPGFVLNDLTIEEDPAFGSEPFLHANTVTASIRLLSLWRGRLEIGQISVDEASLNVVHAPSGHWNLDSLFRNSAVKDGAKARRPLPYLEATNSRINIKNGVEKLPYSLANTDLSFWQENPGDWRIRLRGEPVRTDISLEQGDTGTVRLEGSLRAAASLRQMPIHLDVEWREAQLGQLSRLLAGADPGWRGDLTGELHLDGNFESAQIKTRLRATGVHRAEFAPVAPMDFDARCDATYRFLDRSVDKLVCDSPLGNGHVRVGGELPASTPEHPAQPHLTVELDRVPVAVGLDALRTVRSDFAPNIEARGAVSGKLVYAEAASPDEIEKTTVKAKRHEAPRVNPHGSLTGSMNLEDFQLSGGTLSSPVVISRLTLEPVADESGMLAATASIPAGGAMPLIVSARISMAGYQVGIRGQAAVVRAREFAHMAGSADAALLDTIAGDPLSVDLNAQGPWMPAEKAPFAGSSIGKAAAGASDALSGTISLHNANWKSEYLANHVVISQATLHLSEEQLNWEPVIFSYGPVKGSATVALPANCLTKPSCVPHFTVQFAQLDASALQAAILGAQEKVTVISTLLAKLHPSSAPAWPHLEGTVKADSLIVGPLTIRDAVAQVKVADSGAEVSSFEATMLGGKMHGSGALTTPGSEKEKPAYRFEGSFEKLNPAAVGQLLDQHWAGGVFEAQGKVELSGFTQADLAASAKGSLHFDWQHGAAAGADLARFDRWTADAEIANGAIQLKQNELKRGAHSGAVQASATLGAGAKASFAKQAETQAKR